MHLQQDLKTLIDQLNKVIQLQIDHHRIIKEQDHLHLQIVTLHNLHLVLHFQYHLHVLLTLLLLPPPLDNLLHQVEVDLDHHLLIQLRRPHDIPLLKIITNLIREDQEREGIVNQGTQVGDRDLDLSLQIDQLMVIEEK